MTGILSDCGRVASPRAPSAPCNLRSAKPCSFLITDSSALFPLREIPSPKPPTPVNLPRNNLDCLPNMNRLFIFLFLAISPVLKAGTAETVIHGNTESSRTQVEVRVDDSGSRISYVKLTIDGESYFIDEIDSLPQAFIRDEKNSVCFIVVEARGRQFRLWMVPKSEKIIEREPGTYRSRFAAVIEATDPRKAKKGKLTPWITIGCTLEWVL